MRAITEQPSLAWSPLGGKLAFIGAAQGPSADLYEYILDSGEILQLTDGPAQAFNPVWSPDAKYIIQPAAETFGTGAGGLISGVFAAHSDGTGAFSLYPVPERSGGESAIGWLSGDMLVAHSWFMTCGDSDIRLVNLSTRNVTPVWNGCFSSAAAASVGGSMLVSTEGNFGDFGTDTPAGIYRITLADPQPRKISDAPARIVRWSAAGSAFFAVTSDGSGYEISAMGDVQTLPVQTTSFPLISPDGRTWAWFNVKGGEGSTGIWIGDRPLTGGASSLRRIFDGQILGDGISMWASWSPDSKTIAFLDSQNTLYLAQAPDWTVVQIGPVAPPPQEWDMYMAWVSG